MNEDNILFLDIDIEKFVRKLLEDKLDELNITSMTEEERKAFDYGVDLVFSLINAVTDTTSPEVAVVLTDDEIGTEYTLEELIKYVSDKEAAKFIDTDK